MEHEWNGKVIVVVSPDFNVAHATVHANPPNIAVETNWLRLPSDADKEFFERAIQAILPVPLDGYISADAVSKDDCEAMAKRFVNASNN